MVYYSLARNLADSIPNYPPPWGRPWSRSFRGIARPYSYRKSVGGAEVSNCQAAAKKTKGFRVFM